MKLLRHIEDIHQHITKCIATIGNFDGVHLGHQAIFHELKQKSKQHNLPSVVISFEPLPQEYFKTKDIPARLSNFREKYYLLSQQEIDIWLCLAFKHIAPLYAIEFIEQVLLKLNIQHLIIGDDFRFGYKRCGDFHLLKSLNKFTVANTPTIRFNQQERISSTTIRRLLAENLLQQAQAWLGHAYFIQGRVIHGDKRGRTIGFPTANIHLKRKKTALRGVYIVKIIGLEKYYYGVANIGIRPTVDGLKEQLEVHLFNFSANIYGTYLTVEFLEFIRGEQRFHSIETLISAIQEDVYFANQWLDKKGLG